MACINVAHMPPSLSPNTHTRATLQLWLSVCEMQFRATGLCEGKSRDADAGASADADAADVVDAWRSITDQAISYMTEYFPPQGDVHGALSFYRARTEAKVLANIEGARAAIEHFIKVGDAHAADIWLEYARFEREFGDTTSARVVFRRAVERVREDVEPLYHAYTRFEREEGTLEHVFDARTRIRKRCAMLEQREAERAVREKAAEAERETRAKDKRKSEKKEKGKGNDADKGKGKDRDKSKSNDAGKSERKKRDGSGEASSAIGAAQGTEERGGKGKKPAVKRG